ncbi:terminase small subunit [Acinetobacter sp. B10A]|uniref:terminase small subunit n=1 Tax=Acinetobacter baretiae TaxID=2605383 RepID=UPI001B3C9126|nr:terminase small subunit [Acinetobacter baretiae]MBF7685983.1 terminase small subunit [Acinetobacter baretiae]
MALTSKMRKFAEAIVEGKSKKEAAISAGYSTETASQQASKLSKNPEVLEYIEKLTSSEKLTSKKEKVNSEVESEFIPAKREQQKKDTEQAEKIDSEFVGRGEIPIGAIDDPLEYLKAVWTNEFSHPDDRLKAAIAGLPYVHGKVASKGKKETRAEEAKNKAGTSGKFGTLNSQIRPS